MINESFETINIVNFTDGLPSEIFIMPVIYTIGKFVNSDGRIPAPIIIRIKIWQEH